MKRLVTVIVLLLIIVALGFGFWTAGNAPVDSKDKSSKIFVINRGESVREIGNSLKSENLIKNPVVFFLYIKLKGQDKNIQAGDYRLSPSMTLAEVIDSLQHGSLDIWITVPEGLRAKEIADILKKDLPSYDESWRPILIENEGFLYPDTYLIPRDATVDQVVSVMRNNLNKKLEGTGSTVDDPSMNKILAIASLIEREAITDGEKPLISGVIQNRLSIGMPLQIDASIQYAKGNRSKWWPQVFTDDYKSVVSPYNTYLRTGLTPAPIANPGIEAIKAAQNPQEHDYIYYIHDKNKQIHPAKTINEHNANVNKYL